MGRAGRLLLIVALLFGAGATTSSCASTCDTNYAPTSTAFVGQLQAVHGSTATFRVDRWIRPARTDPTVDVHYSGSTIQFLHVGRRYSVQAWKANNGLQGDVRTAACSFGGTVYADGSSIDTSLWSRSVVRNALIGFVLAVVAVLLLLVWLTRRHVRRRHRELSEMRNPGSP